MGEMFDLTQTSQKDPFKPYYLYEPGREGLSRDREAYLRMWGLMFGTYVEIRDSGLRRKQIERVYRMAHELDFSAGEMNELYEAALEGMSRPESPADQIEYAVYAPTNERVQVWPPDLDAIKRLQQLATRSAYQSIR